MAAGGSTGHPNLYGPGDSMAISLLPVAHLLTVTTSPFLFLVENRLEECGKRVAKANRAPDFCTLLDGKDHGRLQGREGETSVLPGSGVYKEEPCLGEVHTGKQESSILWERQDCHWSATILQLISLVLLAALLVAVLVKGSDVSSSQEHEQQQVKQDIHQELDQLKAGLDRLCRPCPWDWTLFQGNCYFFSTFQQNWKDSMFACEEVGAQLVVIKSHEEQSFLQRTSKKIGYVWMGLSDIKQEGKWVWLDNSPLKWSQYWARGEPNNVYDEDCAEFSDNGWNDNICSLEKFWICKKPASPCSR
ncbi:CD209 antigen-like protein C [Peromyscus leucopus]|uniref:CD209 antigen-like protein C n=1 Tax=Peromyscus leucopus TaxID=10041 RepID=UPI0010A180A9|nr:CD209 antigen-like protein C [Peromyscus leucopus]